MPHLCKFLQLSGQLHGREKNSDVKENCIIFESCIAEFSTPETLRWYYIQVIHESRSAYTDVSIIFFLRVQNTERHCHLASIPVSPS